MVELSKQPMLTISYLLYICIASCKRVLEYK